MALRTQLSLIFTDEDLYNNCVVVLKEQRELHSTIIRLLSAYYYRQDIRNLVDEVDTDKFAEEIEAGNNKVQDSIDAIRDSLLMQSFAAEELRQTLDNGAKDMASIVEGTKQASRSTEQSSVKPDAFGAGVARLTMKDVIPKQTTEVSSDAIQQLQESAKAVFSDAQFNVLLQMMKLSAGQGISNVSSEPISNTNTSEVEENQSFTTENEVSTNDASSDFDFSDSVSEFQTASSVSEESTVAEPKVIDATNAMKDLLGSIGV